MAVATIRPTADVLAELDASGSPHYAEVDEAVHDSDTTYIESGALLAGKRDRFNGADASIPVGSTINTVIVKCNIKTIGGIGDGVGLELNHDAVYEGSTLIPTGSYTELSHDFTSSETWQPADFDGVGRAEFGAKVQISVGGQNTRITNIWLEVDYTPPAAGFTVPGLIGSGIIPA